ITFCGSLSHNNYDNNISRMLENVLRWFADDRRSLRYINRFNERDHEAMSERGTEPGEAGDTTIVRAAIYPAIGIARLGNSENEYFLAPEVTDPLPEPPGFYRGSTGALKRQAVRYRVYGLNAAGRAVAELTADNAEIRWNVHLANKKSAWYQFQIAL